MSDSSTASRLLTFGAAVVGLGVGIAAEQILVNQRMLHDAEGGEELGSIHGEPVEVTADDGVHLYVEVDDEPDRPIKDDLTIIFCHGYALNQNSWHYQRRDLRRLGRLVFADQRSHGSSWRSDLEHSTIDQLGLDLGAVIDEVGGPGPVVLVGHSMGGMTIMALAMQRPELFEDGPIAGVALLGTSAGGLGDRPFGLPPVVGRVLHRVAPGVVQAAISNGEVINFGRQYGNDIGLLLTRRYSFGSKVSPALTNFTAEMINATPVEVLAEFLPGLEAHEKSDALSTMATAEALVMVGERDMLTPPPHSREILRYMPNAEFELLPATGHMLMMERYPEVNEAIRELVKRVRQNESTRETS